MSPCAHAACAPLVPSAKRTSSGKYQPSPSSALMPSTPSASTRLACSRHHTSAAGQVKSTGEPMPIHHLATSGSPSASAHEVLEARSSAPGARYSAADASSGGYWPSRESRFTHGVTHTTVRTPSSRSAFQVPRGVRELVRVELPRVVLRRPRGVEHDRVERDAVLAEAGVLGLGLASGGGRRRGSSRTRTPTRAARAGRCSVSRRNARSRAAGVGCVNRWTLQRAGGGAGGEDHLVAELAAHAVAVVLDPGRPAAAGQQRTGPARSRPAGCRRRRACRAGSPGRCRRGRRRAAGGAPPGRRAGRAARRGR